MTAKQPPVVEDEQDVATPPAGVAAALVAGSITFLDREWDLLTCPIGYQLAVETAAAVTA